MENPDKTIELLEKTRAACLANAKDMLRAAEVTLESCELPNVAYHLAALALEEIGKANIVVMKSNLTQIARGETWPSKWMENHSKKLFWALWTPFGAKEEMTQEAVESCRHLARTIHELRLISLYVGVSSGLENDSEPLASVTEEQAKDLIGLAEARLQFEIPRLPLALREEQRMTLQWFTEAVEDENERAFVFSKVSVTKLAATENLFEWISWLRDRKRDRDKECQIALEKELARLKPVEIEASQEKWRMKIRLSTNSHSIRPKSLASWNNHNYPIKLYPITGRKGQLVLELTMPRIVSIHGLWYQALGYLQRFVLAMNIGSIGFFWWELPRQTARYYEEIVDLETGHNVGIDRNPKLEIDWKSGALDEDDLDRIRIAFAVLPGPDNKDSHEPFSHYLTGLAYLAKTDVHIQFEHFAFMEFFRSLKSGMAIYGDWDGELDFSAAFTEVTKEFLTDCEDRDRVLQLGEQGEKRKSEVKNTDLKDVGTMKRICDAYFIRTFYKELLKRTPSKDK